MVFVGYHSTEAYKVYKFMDKMVHISRYVIFNESNAWKWQDTPGKGKHKVKMNPYGIVSRHKARLFVIGFLQKYGINNNEVFAHGSRLETMRLVIEIASSKNCSLY